MALYLKVGQEGITHLYKYGYGGRPDLPCQVLLCIPVTMYLVDSLFNMQKNIIKITTRCEYAVVTEETFMISFASPESMDKFLENHFSNGGQKDEIARLEKKIDELKELIYF